MVFRGVSLMCREILRHVFVMLPRVLYFVMCRDVLMWIYVATYRGVCMSWHSVIFRGTS